MSTQKSHLILVSAAVLALAWASPVQAQEVIVGAGSNPGTGTTIAYSQNTKTGWNIAPNVPQGIYLDPNGSPWVKNLVVNGNGFVVGKPYQLVEPLRVAAGPNGVPAIPWTDYHEQLLDAADFNWVDTAANPFSWQINPAPVPPEKVSWSISGGNVDWTFDPALAVGTQITLTKYFDYTGIGVPPIAPSSVQISQYPTPEPSTPVLLAVGASSALGYGWYRRRRGAK